MVCLNVISQGGGSNLYPPEMAGTFTEEQIQDRIYGSKIVVISEQAMLNVIYTIKACMLVMYTRLTLGLRTQKMVRYLAVYVLVGWLATEIAFFTACRPFPGYWAMPPPNPQCTTLEHYAIVQGSFNISSDLLMLGIPLPLLLRMKMAWKNKVVLVFIFSMGLFVVLAALLTKIFNLLNVWDPVYMLWYVREASVAVYVSNLPMIWPLMREWFPFLRTLTPAAAYPTSEGGGGGSKRPPGGAGATGSRSRALEEGRPPGGSAAAAAALSPRGDRHHGLRSARRPSTGTLDTDYGTDIELKPRPARAKDGDSSSTEEMVRTGSSEDGAGKDHAIHVTVERTVIFQEARLPGLAGAGAEYDVERGIFDWDRMGRFEAEPKK